MADPTDDRARRVAALKDEVKTLSEQIQAIPALVNRRREVVAELMAEQVPVAEIADWLGVSRQAVYQMAKPGKGSRW